MKPSIARPWLSLLLITLVFSGCELLDETDDVQFTTDFELPVPFVVDEDADVPGNPYTSFNSSIEAARDPEYQKYKDRVKHIVVNEIKYIISEFVADVPVTLTSGEAKFFAKDQTVNDAVIASVSNVTIADGSGTLEASAEVLETIANIVLRDGEIHVVSVANISDAPCSFKIKVTLNVTVTANALE